MNNFSKIVIVVVLVLSFLFIKEKLSLDVGNFSFKLPTINKNEKPTTNEIVRHAEEPKVEDNKQEEDTSKQYVTIYFLALDSSDNSIYKKVKREIPQNEDKLEFAIKELLKGPNLIEKTAGAYSEIPNNTKLLKIKQTGSKIIIDFSSDFQYGGGTDSIYSRMMQLIKTSINNSENKKIYLYLDGKQVNFIGGEGIMITQPLSEKSLEI